MSEENTETEGLGVTEYQLYILKGMRPPEPLLAESLRTLGRTAEDMKQAGDKISARVTIKRMLEGDAARNLRAILRDAVIPGTSQEPVLLCRLPLWPSYLYRAEYVESGRYLKDAGFLRDPAGSAEPVLEPWRFTEGDLLGKFDQVRLLERRPPCSAFAVSDYQGGRYRLRFGHGLLQEAERPPGQGSD